MGRFHSCPFCPIKKNLFYFLHIFSYHNISPLRRKKTKKKEGEGKGKRKGNRIYFLSTVILKGQFFNIIPAIAKNLVLISTVKNNR